MKTQSNQTAKPMKKYSTEDFRTNEIWTVLRRKNQMSEVIQELIVDRELKTVDFDQDREEYLLNQFKEERGMDGDNGNYKMYLEKNYMDEELLRWILTRPERLVQYRNERWGDRAKSLYLDNKEQYDTITFRYLELQSEDVIQEIYFRIKDKEDSWDNIAKQIPSASKDGTARMGPIPVSQLDGNLVDAMRKAGKGKIIKPMKQRTTTIIAELEEIDFDEYNDKIKTKVLNFEFQKWIMEKMKTYMNQMELGK